MRFISSAFFAMAVLGTMVSACGDDGSTSATDTGGTGGTGATGTAGGSTAGGGTGGTGATAGTGGTTGGTGPGGGGSGGVPCTPVGVETCGTDADEDCDGTDCALWARVYGDATHSQGASFTRVTASGDVYFASAFNEFDPNDLESIEFGGMTISPDADSQQFIAKVSSAGEDQWIKKLPSSKNFAFSSPWFTVLPNGGVLATIIFSETINLGGSDLVPDGLWFGDIALVAYGPDGEHLWSKALYGVDSVGVTHMAASEAGKVVLLGSGNSTVTYDGQELAPADVKSRFLFEVDAADGSLGWHSSFQFGMDPVVYLNALRFDAIGDLLIAGSYYGGPVAIGGAPLPASGPQGFDAFVTRFTAAGNHVSDTVFCNGDCDVHDLAPGPNGVLNVSGTLSNSNIAGQNVLGFKSYVAQLDAAGQGVWSHIFTTENDNNGIGVPEVEVEPNGDVVFAIEYHDTINLGFQAFTAQGMKDLVVGRFEAGGLPMWARSFGAPGMTMLGLGLASVSVQSDGYITIAPWMYQGSVDFGSGTVDEIGNGDMVVVRMAP